MCGNDSSSNPLVFISKNFETTHEESSIVSDSCESSTSVYLFEHPMEYTMDSYEDRDVSCHPIVPLNCEVEICDALCADDHDETLSWLCFEDSTLVPYIEAENIEVDDYSFEIKDITLNSVCCGYHKNCVF